MTCRVRLAWSTWRSAAGQRPRPYCSCTPVRRASRSYCAGGTGDRDRSRGGVGVRQAAGRRRRWIELGGLAIGLAAGLGIAFGVLIPGHQAGSAAAVYHQPVRVQAAPAQPDPAALDAQWVAYSDQSGCADWAGGDGVSAVRLNSSQLAWFFSDTYLG